MSKSREYIIIGAGPAAICAIPSLLKEGIAKEDILWIDPEFKVGAFGTDLSKGSSVPGNTSVKSYRQVNQEIQAILNNYATHVTPEFAMNALGDGIVCSLKTAAEPMQHMTETLRSIIPSTRGKVTNIKTNPQGMEIEIKLPDGTTAYESAKRVILATGAQAKNLVLPPEHHTVKMLAPNTVFIESELKEFLRLNPDIKTVAVIGSSHSAALATMHLLKAGLNVKQFMDKDYKYAKAAVSAAGTKYTMFDNTGLKGDVAEFTRKLLADQQVGNSEYQTMLTRYIGKNRDEATELLRTNLADCSHAVATIGYAPSATLTIDGKPLAELRHNATTTEFEAIPGLYGIGVAFPEQVKAISGEVEFAVGLGKFWATANKRSVLDAWKKEPVMPILEVAVSTTHSSSQKDSIVFFKSVDSNESMRNTPKQCNKSESNTLGFIAN